MCEVGVSCGNSNVKEMYIGNKRRKVVSLGKIGRFVEIAIGKMA